MAKQVAAKTNAVRKLQRLGVAVELRSYPIGDGHQSAAQVAQILAVDPATVFKTLLARGDRTGLLFAVLPSTQELDLKALARTSGDHKVSLVPLNEVQSLTGYVRGGVTAVAAKKDYPVFLHDSALDHTRIAVSAGQRGTQMLVDPADFRNAAVATLFS